MSKNKSKKCLSSMLASTLLLASVSLSGCQMSPKMQSVVSKNDGSFDTNAVISASEQHEPDAIQKAKYIDTFTSTDGTVTFQISIDESILAADMPVVEAEPHILTGEDTRRVAQALFGESPCYEQGHFLYPIYSKAQIQERLLRWSEYVNNPSALDDLYGESNYDMEVFKRAIENYTAQYESAPNDSPYGLTNWEFVNCDYRWATEEEIEFNGLQGNFDEIALIIPANEIYYTFSSAIRDESTSKLSHISIMPGCGISPYEIDERIFYASLCRTDYPTDEQIENAKIAAMSLLKKMDLGEWCIDDCYVGHPAFGNENEYIINVDAVPMISGVPTGVMNSSIAPQSSAYAFVYYESLAHFEFSSDGTIVCFDMMSPINILREVNDNVAVMNIDSLLNIAKNHLVLSDYYTYGGSGIIDGLKETEAISCVVTIDHLDYRLLRVPVRDSEMTFYYVPSITLSGTVEYYGTNSGMLYYQTNRTLVSINAVDGSVIS